MYVDGKTYTNQPTTQLVETSGDRQPVYSSSAMKVEISDRGKSSLTSAQNTLHLHKSLKIQFLQIQMN